MSLTITSRSNRRRASVKLYNADISTILAALRHYQYHLERGDALYESMIADNMGTLDPLTAEQIDNLCDRINNEEDDDE